MKKSKLLILIPLVALTMSGCDFSFLSSSSDSSASTESRVDEGSTHYESYTLLYGFYYQGDLESIPEDTSLYLYGDLVGDTFTPLEANSNGYYGTTLKDIEYGTYSYSLYIDYNTNEISLDSPLVCSGEETVSSASSSGGNLFITLTSSFNELLGEATTPGDTPEETTYTIEVDNAEALSNLTYDENAVSQTSVDLQVYLVTTPSVGNPERIAASEGDVELSNYAETIISVSGLTVTPVGKGNTSITISKEGYQSTSVEVNVSDITVTGENNQITLYFTFMYESSKQTIPENAKVYICGGWDGGDWSTDSVSTLQYDSTNECYYAVITYSEDVMNNHWYNYNLYLAGINDSFSWDLTKLCSDNLWWTHEDGSYTKSEEITLSDTFENLLSGDTSGDEGGNTGSGTTDGGKPDATYIHNFTLVVTIYDSTGNTVKKAPSGYDLYIAGDMDGTWNTNYDGYYDWCSPVKLVEATDESGNLAYTYTFGYVEENSSPSYNIYYTATDSEFSWDQKLGSSDFSFTVDSSASDGHTQYVTCNIDSNLDNFMEDASDTSAGGDEGPSQGGDTGDQGTTAVDNYTIIFTIYDTNGAVQTCPNYGSLYLHGNFGGQWIADGEYYEWSTEYVKLTETTYNSHVAYSATFDGVIPGETYAFDVCFIYDGEETSTWRPINPADSYGKYDFYCTISSDAKDGDTQYQDLTGCYTLASEFVDKTELGEYKLVFTIYDTTNTVQECPDWGTLQITGEFDKTWNEGNWWDWGPNHDLTTTTDKSGNVAYEISFEGLEVGESYAFNIVFMYNDTSKYSNEWNPIRNNNFSVTITIDEDNSSVQYVNLTECYTLASQYPLNTTTDPEQNPGGDDDDESFHLTIAIKDSGATSKDFSIYSSLDNTDHEMNKATDTSEYDQYYTYEAGKDWNITWNIHQTGETEYTTNSSASTGLGRNMDIGWSNTNYYLWATYQTWGVSWYDNSTGMSGLSGWEDATSLTIILTFNFGSYSSGTVGGNYLVSNVSFVLA